MAEEKQPLLDSTFANTLQSSAYHDIKIVFSTVSMSLLNMRKGIGPRMLPWTTDD
jgi:hypothetical protein